jgi:hypothetical protein
VHLDRLSEDPLGLGLKGVTIVVPVDEPRNDQRREQRYDN